MHKSFLEKSTQNGATNYLFKGKTDFGLAQDGVTVARATMMALWGGHAIPQVALLPRYVFCRAFQKRYDWYCDNSMWREVKSVFYSHIWQVLEKCRYGHGDNKKSPVGVGWVKWAAELGEACDPLFEGVGLMHPCEHCGNYLAEQHTAAITSPCECHSAEGQPTGKQRLVENLVDAHHCVVAMMHQHFVEGRPGALAFIDETSSCLQASDTTNTLKPVIRRMETDYLRQLISGSSEKVVPGKNLNFRVGDMYLCNWYWHMSIDVSKTVWAVSEDRRHNGKKRLEVVMDAWLETLSNNQDTLGLLLQCLTGCSNVSLSGEVVQIGYTSFTNFDHSTTGVS